MNEREEDRHDQEAEGAERPDGNGLPLSVINEIAHQEAAPEDFFDDGNNQRQPEEAGSEKRRSSDRVGNLLKGVEADTVGKESRQRRDNLNELLF